MAQKKPDMDKEVHSEFETSQGNNFETAAQETPVKAGVAQKNGGSSQQQHSEGVNSTSEQDWELDEQATATDKSQETGKKEGQREYEWEPQNGSKK